MAMEVTPRGRLLEGWDVPMDSSGGVQSLDGLGLEPDIGEAVRITSFNTIKRSDADGFRVPPIGLKPSHLG
jgi:hypothetical protein